MELTKEQRIEMYWMMLLARRLDERAWVLHRQGKIAFHISGIGQEAAQVGAAFALNRGEDWVTPYYRDLALMICLGYTPREFVLSLMG
ncbi:MAG: thiamine pyrophosphate-dependent dehydrogenase E1 component subunit alpha, partial [Chloroflexi bacterium]|nr:thiamine pyrophosphate-dependent dehydrogenase E1 component subunit alpha [Chloroflexota bacterium]